MKVKVYSTQMGEKEIETSATTWGELQRDLSSNSVNYDKMKAVIGENKLTLEADGAMLPATGFTLFLMNKKTKAGAKKSLATYKYGELRGTIRYILDQDPSQTTYFNKGRNYTTKSTDKLKELLSYYEGVTPSLDDVMIFIAAAKANKAIKKTISIKKNEVKEPIRGFGADVVKTEDISTAKVTEEEDVIVELHVPTEPNIQEEEFDSAVEVLVDSEDVKELDIFEQMTNTLVSLQYPQTTKIQELVSQICAKLSHLSVKVAEAREAELERLAEEARAIKEAARIAKEKEAHDNEMRDEMSSLMEEFEDVKF